MLYLITEIGLLLLAAVLLGLLVGWLLWGARGQDSLPQNGPTQSDIDRRPPASPTVALSKIGGFQAIQTDRASARKSKAGEAENDPGESPED